MEAGGRKLALASQCNAVLALLSFFVKSALASYTPVLKDIHAWILSLLLQCVKKYKAIIILHCKYIYTYSEITLETGHMSQCARTDLNKRFLPKPMTTTG